MPCSASLSPVCAHCLWLPEMRTISQVASCATDPHRLLLQSVINALQSLYSFEAGLAQACYGVVVWSCCCRASPDPSSGEACRSVRGALRS